MMTHICCAPNGTNRMALLPLELRARGAAGPQYVHVTLPLREHRQSCVLPSTPSLAEKSDVLTCSVFISQPDCQVVVLADRCRVLLEMHWPHRASPVLWRAERGQTRGLSQVSALTGHRVRPTSAPGTTRFPPHTPRHPPRPRLVRSSEKASLMLQPMPVSLS